MASYGRSTLQVEGGSEITIREGSTNNTTYVEFPQTVHAFYDLNVSVTIRWYAKISNSAGYCYMTNMFVIHNFFDTNLTLLKSYNITLPSDSEVIYRITVNIPALGAVYVNIDDTRLDGGIFSSLTGAITGILKLSSGQHTVKVEAGMFEEGTLTVSSVKMGVVKFSDMLSITPTTYSSSLSLTQTSRKTCVGALKNTVLHVTISARTPNDTTSISSGTNYVKILVDGVEPTYIVARSATTSDFHAVAKIALPVSCGAQHIITVEKSNANTIVTIYYVASPWLLSNTDYEPFAFSFPQGSTLYVTLEPLIDNTTFALKIGKKRAVSFGDSTDYYYASTGTGILSSYYTFETVEVGGCVLQTSGYGGCVSIIAVDVRGIVG